MAEKGRERAERTMKIMTSDSTSPATARKATSKVFPVKLD